MAGLTPSFAAYVGNELVAVGTAQELGEDFGIQPERIPRLATKLVRQNTPPGRPRFYRLGDNSGDSMESRDKEIARLRDDGFSEKEIASSFGMSVYMVNSALSRVDNGRYSDE